MIQRYPRNATEARNFLQKMDQHWASMIKDTSKRARIRSWVSIARAMSDIHKQAVDFVDESNKAFLEAKKNFNLIEAVRISLNYNFHKNFLDKVERWMKLKKIPF